MGIISRSLVSAFSDLVEFSNAAVQKSPALVTDEFAAKRRMINETVDSLYDRFDRKCKAHGVGYYERESDLRVAEDIETERRAKDRALTMQRRQARMLKGEAAIVA